MVKRGQNTDWTTTGKYGGRSINILVSCSREMFLRKYAGYEREPYVIITRSTGGTFHGQITDGQVIRCTIKETHKKIGDGTIGYWKTLACISYGITACHVPNYRAKHEEFGTYSNERCSVLNTTYMYSLKSGKEEDNEKCALNGTSEEEEEDKCTLYGTSEEEDPAKCTLNGTSEEEEEDKCTLYGTSEEEDRAKCTLNGTSEEEEEDKCTLNGTSEEEEEGTEKCKLNGTTEEEEEDKCTLNGTSEEEDPAKCTLNGTSEEGEEGTEKCKLNGTSEEEEEDKCTLNGTSEEEEKDTEKCALNGTSDRNKEKCVLVWCRFDTLIDIALLRCTTHNPEQVDCALGASSSSEQRNESFAWPSILKKTIEKGFELGTVLSEVETGPLIGKKLSIYHNGKTSRKKGRPVGQLMFNAIGLPLVNNKEGEILFDPATIVVKGVKPDAHEPCRLKAKDLKDACEDLLSYLKAIASEESKNDGGGDGEQGEDDDGEDDEEGEGGEDEEIEDGEDDEESEDGEGDEQNEDGEEGEDEVQFSDGSQSWRFSDLFSTEPFTFSGDSGGVYFIEFEHFDGQIVKLPIGIHRGKAEIGDQKSCSLASPIDFVLQQLDALPLNMWFPIL